MKRNSFQNDNDLGHAAVTFERIFCGARIFGLVHEQSKDTFVFPVRHEPDQVDPEYPAQKRRKKKLY